MDEARLIEKLRLIETLYAGATTDGEKIAAQRARQRLQERLARWEEEDPPVEHKFTMVDMWSRKVFVALLRRYGIQPYRRRGQRRTTVMARLSERFVSQALWPEFQELSEALRTYLSDVTDRVVRQVIHEDSSEAEVVEKPGQLPFAIAGTNPAPESTAPSSVMDQEQREPPPGQAAKRSSSTGRVKDRRRKRKKRKRR